MAPAEQRDDNQPFPDFHRTPALIRDACIDGTQHPGRGGERFNRIYIEAIQILPNKTLSSPILKYSNIFYCTQTTSSSEPHLAPEIKRAFSLALSVS